MITSISKVMSCFESKLRCNCFHCIPVARLFNSIQEGESPNDTPESEHLTKEDFEVGIVIEILTLLTRNTTF